MDRIVTDAPPRPPLTPPSPPAPGGGHVARRGTHVVIEPRKGWRSLGLGEVWRYRELLYFIGWRDVKVRYKQTALGGAWAVLQPFLMMLVFTLFVGKFAPHPDDVPYPVFAYAGLLPWTLFASSLTGASQSLVMSSNLVSKVYFPRLILPVAACGSFLLDFVLAFFVFGGLMLYYDVTPGAEILALPIFTGFALLAALAVGIWFSALNVRYRDIVYAVPFLVQLWLFATPVAYSSTIVDDGLGKIVYGLNPMAGVVESFRWALLGTPAPATGLLVASLSATIFFFVAGLIYFERTQRTFADVI